MDVEDQARRILHAIRRQELLGRSESFHIESNRPHQAVQGLADGRIVIYDRDAME